MMSHYVYYIEPQSGGRWAVKESLAGQTVTLNGQACRNLSREEAEELAEYLTALDNDLAA